MTRSAEQTQTVQNIYATYSVKIKLALVKQKGIPLSFMIKRNYRLLISIFSRVTNGNALINAGNL